MACIPVPACQADHDWPSVQAAVSAELLVRGAGGWGV